MDSEKIPIIIPTYHKMERFLNSALNLLQHTWPSHGPTFIFTDDIYRGQILNACKTFRFDSKLNWVEILYKGIKLFRSEYPEISNIYLILDDLVPLTSLNEEKMKLIEKSFIEREWQYLYYPHYNNDYKFDTNVNNSLFCQTKKEYTYYSQIGAGLIKVDYLIQLCELALMKEAYTPWQFEFLKSDENHYITEYRWPSVKDGFSKSKFINNQAIDMLNYPEGQALRKLLKIQKKKELRLRAYRWILQKRKNLIHKAHFFKKLFLGC